MQLVRHLTSTPARIVLLAALVGILPVSALALEPGIRGDEPDTLGTRLSRPQQALSAVQLHQRFSAEKAQDAYAVYGRGCQGRERQHENQRFFG